MGTADFDDGFPILRVSEPAPLVDLRLVIFFTGNFLTRCFMVLFIFDREDVFFTFFTSAFGATFLLTAFFFGCFFGLDNFTTAFLLDNAIFLHPL